MTQRPEYRLAKSFLMGQTLLFVFGREKQPPFTVSPSSPGRFTIALASVHLVVWSSCHKACVKPAVGQWRVLWREMPIYEGGQCRQSQFYSREIYTELRHSVTAFFFLSFFFGGVAGAASLQRLRPSPVTPLPPLFLKVICVCTRRLGGLGLYHLGKQRRPVLCHSQGSVERAGCERGRST